MVVLSGSWRFDVAGAQVSNYFLKIAGSVSRANHGLPHSWNPPLLFAQRGRSMRLSQPSLTRLKRKIFDGTVDNTDTRLLAWKTEYHPKIERPVFLGGLMKFGS